MNLIVAAKTVCHRAHRFCDLLKALRQFEIMINNNHVYFFVGHVSDKGALVMKRGWILGFSVMLSFPASPLFSAIRYEFRQTTRTEAQSLPASSLVGRAVIEGLMSRIDFISGYSHPVGSYVISKDGFRSVAIVDPAKQTYTEVETSNVATALGTSKIEITNLKTNVRKLSDRPTIAGIPAEHWVLESSYDITVMFGTLPLRQTVQTTIDKWVTTSLGNVGANLITADSLRTGNPELDRIIELESTKIQGFPLRQVMTIRVQNPEAARNPNSKIKLSASRTQTSEIIVTSLQTASVDRRLFDVPASFRKVQSSGEKEEAGVHMLNLEPATQPQSRNR